MTQFMASQSIPAWCGDHKFKKYLESRAKNDLRRNQFTLTLLIIDIEIKLQRLPVGTGYSSQAANHLFHS